MHVDSLSHVTCSLSDPCQHLYQPHPSRARRGRCVRCRQPAFRANIIPAPVFRRHCDQTGFTSDACYEGAVFPERVVWKHDKLRRSYQDREDFCASDLTNVH